MTWTHHFTATAPAPRYGPRMRLTVDAGLHQIPGNAAPYFTVTGTVGKRAGGCLHDDILAAWPALRPVVTLHLSDDQGVPMHAEANAWYYLAGYYGGAGERFHYGNSPNTPRFSEGASPDECLRQFADHVRVSVFDARFLADGWGRTLSGDWAMVRARLNEWLAAQRPRWKAEADAAIALLDGLIAKGDETNGLR